jgi:hypothetical protein
LSKYRIVNLLKTFSDEEMKRFSDFVKSPYFNKFPKLHLLFEKLSSQLSSNMAEDLTSQKLFAEVNPGRKYDDVLFRKYMSNLALLAEEFLGVQEAWGKRGKRHTSILSGLANKDCGNSFLNYAGKIGKENSVYRARDYSDFLEMHLQSLILFNYYVENEQSKKSVEELRKGFHYLFLYFLFHYSFAINQSELDAITSPLSHTDDSLSLISGIVSSRELAEKLLAGDWFRNKTEMEFVEIILNDSALLSSDAADSSFLRIMEAVMGERKYENLYIRHYLLNRLIAFFNVQKLKGKSIKEEDVFKVWKQLISVNEIHNEKRANLSIRDFRGVLNTALKNNDLKWAYDYVSKFSGRVRKESRENLLNYGNAIIAFSSGDFESSLHFLNLLKRESWILTFDSYILKTQLFYELDYIRSTLSAIDSFRHYLLKMNFDRSYASWPLEFIKVVRRLVSLKEEPDSKKIRNMILKLESNPCISKSQWLMEKAQELKTIAKG